MWNEKKQQQLDDLRRRELAGTLGEQEKQTLEQLLGELEGEEWGALGVALDRLLREQQRLQEERGQRRLQNAGLVALAGRQEDLLRRANLALVDLLSEHETLKAEYERVTGQPLLGTPSFAAPPVTA